MDNGIKILEELHTTSEELSVIYADHHKTLTRLGLPCETLTKLNEEYLMVAHKLDLAIKMQQIINTMK